MRRFCGQKTEAVTSLILEQKILNEYVPNNMTNCFQVLDLTVNKWVKDFMKQKFNEWFATQLGVIQKVHSLKISSFSPPSPLFVPVRFTCTSLPPQRTFALVSYPPLKKGSATLMTLIPNKKTGG